MDAQATDGPSQRKQAPGEEWENIVWGGTAEGAQRPTAAPATQPATRRQDGLSQDGQLLEAGYGHGV